LLFRQSKRHYRCHYLFYLRGAPSWFTENQHSRTQFSVHHSRREAAVPFSLSNERDEFYLYFYWTADERSGWSPTHNTLLLCLIQVSDAITECNYRRACHSGLCFRQAESSSLVS
jgi:hypothetical protein